MATKSADSTGTLNIIKAARFITYIVYGFAILACIFLGFGFFLLLFGANYNVPFVQFIYNGAADFLQPFRGIFPPHQISETSYFSASALFAIVVYLLFALAVQSLISYLTAKIEQFES
jgi:uncharacterized protein YggT (Ycf19 family)